jgi:hypothetical protein
MTTTVNHKLFGQGQLIELNEKLAIVNFDGEEKRMDIRFANLTDIEGNAIIYIKPKKAKAVKLQPAKSVKGTPDFDILFRLGVVDLNGNYCDSDLDVLVDSQIERRNDIKKFGY